MSTRSRWSKRPMSAPRPPPDRPRPHSPASNNKNKAPRCRRCCPRARRGSSCLESKMKSTASFRLPLRLFHRRRGTIPICRPVVGLSTLRKIIESWSPWPRRNASTPTQEAQVPRQQRRSPVGRRPINCSSNCPSPATVRWPLRRNKINWIERNSGRRRISVARRRSGEGCRRPAHRPARHGPIARRVGSCLSPPTALLPLARRRRLQTLAARLLQEARKREPPPAPSPPLRFRSPLRSPPRPPSLCLPRAKETAR